MPHYIALDVSQKTTAICIVDEQGRRVWRGACTTDPEAIPARIFRHAGVVDVKVGVKTGSMTPGSCTVCAALALMSNVWTPGV